LQIAEGTFQGIEGSKYEACPLAGTMSIGLYALMGTVSLGFDRLSHRDVTPLSQRDLRQLSQRNYPNPELVEGSKCRSVRIV